jgi:trimethylguanosine synthase
MAKRRRRHTKKKLDLDLTDQLKSLGLPTAFQSTSKAPVKIAKEKKTLSKHSYSTNFYPLKDLMAIPQTEPQPLESKVMAKKKEQVLDRNTMKFYRNRYDLFSLYDQGCQLDDEGWYSITPESIARHTAQLAVTPSLVWDAFCGVAGNAIQFAVAGHHVIASDISLMRLEMARHNAEIYGVADYIDLVLGDAFSDWFRTVKNKRTDGIGMQKDVEIKEHLMHGNGVMTHILDCIFLSPPWGGPKYLKHETFDPRTMLPIDLERLSRKCHLLAKQVIYYMPKTTDLSLFARLLPPGLAGLAVEEHYMGDHLKVLIITPL